MLRLVRAIRAEGYRRNSERGQVMVAVVGLLAVTVVITAVVATATVRAAGFTTMTRAGVEAQAAAESGVQAAVVALNNGDCVSNVPLARSYGDVDPSLTGTEATAPYFLATVASRSGSTASWQATCPSGETTEVRITSTGFALNGGLSDSNSGRDDAAVEAIYAWDVTPAAPSDPIPASGASLYSFGSPGVNYGTQHFTLNPSPDGLPPTLQLKRGNFVCNGSSIINGSLDVEGGSVSLQNSGCRVTGDIRTGGGYNSTSAARVDGSVYASGMWNSTYSANMSNAGHSIGGDLVAQGPVHGRGSVGGDILAGPGTGNSRFFNDVRVGGDLMVAGGLTRDGGLPCSANCGTNQGVANALKALPHVQGQVRFGQTGMAPPVPPTVPGWVDFDYDRSDWITASGEMFDEVLIGSSECGWSWAASPGLQKFQAAIATGRPTIVNALACSNGISWYESINPTLTNDLVIVAHKFEMGGTGTWSSADGTLKRLWMITPDRSDDGMPSCNSPAANSTFNSQTRMTSTIAAMFYSPCNLANNSVEWRGQMYAQNAVINGGLVLTYTPVGLPGVDLSTGTTGGQPGGSGSGTAEEVVGALVSFRDIPVPTS